MFKYELMFIVKPDLEEANIKKVGEEMKTLGKELRSRTRSEDE